MKLNLDNLLIYLLFFSIFTPYVLPVTVRQIIKITTVFAALIYMISHYKKTKIFNISLIVVSSMITSCFLNFLNSHATFRQFLDGVLYALIFYVIYTLFSYCGRKGKSEILIKCLFRIAFVYCLLALLCLNVTFGLSSGDANLTMYLFGNKFVMSYLFIMLTALFYSCYNKKIQQLFYYKILYYSFVGCSVFISIRYGCMTALMANLVPMFFLLTPKKIKKQLYNPIVILTVVLITAVFPFVITGILENANVQHFVTDVLNRNLTLTSRTKIYSVYLVSVLSNGGFWGYGYSYNIMRAVSVFYNNAQNGLLDYIIKYGFVGGVCIVTYIILCFKRSKKNDLTDGGIIIVYAMLIAGTVEVTYSWMLFIGIAIIGTSFLRDRNE